MCIGRWANSESESDVFDSGDVTSLLKSCSRDQEVLLRERVSLFIGCLVKADKCI